MTEHLPITANPAATLLAHPWVCFYLETAGPNPHVDRIVTASIVHIDAADRSKTRARTWLVNPDIEIPAEATAVHGITNEMVRADGMDAATAVAQVLAELSATPQPVIVAFNAAFDITVLHREAQRLGLPPARAWGRCRAPVGGAPFVATRPLAHWWTISGSAVLDGR